MEKGMIFQYVIIGVVFVCIVVYVVWKKIVVNVVKTTDFFLLKFSSFKL